MVMSLEDTLLEKKLKNIFLIPKDFPQSQFQIKVDYEVEENSNTEEIDQSEKKFNYQALTAQNTKRKKINERKNGSSSVIKT